MNLLYSVMNIWRTGGVFVAILPTQQEVNIGRNRFLAFM